MVTVISGCGGGYDIFGALLVQQIEADTILCNFSFTSHETLRRYDCQEVTKDCFLVKLDNVPKDEYFPEAELCVLLNGHTVYALCVDTAQDLKTFYESLGIIDTLILVDGGCDALLTGRETNLGTPVEDWMHIRAILDLNIPNKHLAAIGLNVDCADGVIESELINRLDEIPHMKRTLLSRGDPNVEQYMNIVEKIDRTKTNIHSLVYQTLTGKRGYIAPERPGAEALVNCCDLTITLIEADIENIVRDNIYIHNIQSHHLSDDIEELLFRC